MEVIQINSRAVRQLPKPAIQETEVSSDQFIGANTRVISFDHLKGDCIIPVFTDSEPLISHSQFIETAQESAHRVFKNERILKPAIRVSHPIRGRKPDAMYKLAGELEEDEITRYYERMAFVLEIPSIHDSIDGNTLNLTVGGVRAYHHENLYGRKTEERFKVFIGFQNAKTGHIDHPKPI